MPKKKLEELTFPDDIRYSKDHAWVRMHQGVAVSGITDHAQNQLGDVVFIDLPETGDTVQAGEAFGSIESMKTVSELFMPVSGSIIEVNETLEDAPETVNRSPYHEGWIVKIRPDNPDISSMMDAAAYQNMLQKG